MIILQNSIYWKIIKFESSNLIKKYSANDSVPLFNTHRRCSQAQYTDSIQSVGNRNFGSLKTISAFFNTREYEISGISTCMNSDLRKPQTMTFPVWNPATNPIYFRIPNASSQKVMQLSSASYFFATTKFSKVAFRNLFATSLSRGQAPVAQ